MGGSGNDSVYELSLSGDTLILAGVTDSPGLATVGAFDSIDPEPEKLISFVQAMKTDGELLWRTYLRSLDAFPAIDDSSGVVYVGGRVGGFVPGLTQPDSHKPNSNSSPLEPDGFLARFGPAGEVVWGTYYGGKGLQYDDIFAVVVDPGGDVYIAGRSNCLDGIATPGTHKDSTEGGGDGYLARFTADGERVWGTYYGGLGSDAVRDLAQLPNGDLVLYGWTMSEEQIATPGAFQEVYAGDFDTFLARVDPSGQRVWGTYYGGNDHDGTGGLTTTPQGQIYISTITQSLGLATDDAFQTVLGGSDDTLVTKFDLDGTRRWATYYGGTNNESTRGIAAAGVNALFLIGTTNSPDGIATPGALDTSFESLATGFVAHFSQGLGVACDDVDGCPSGFCVDGVCCERECGECGVCAAALGATEDGACTLLGPDVVCRPGSDCDPAETCDGQSSACPADVTTPDGDPCEGGVCTAEMCVPDEPTSGTSDGGGSSRGSSSGTPDASAGGTAGEGMPDGCGCASASEPGMALAVLISLARRRRPKRARRPEAASGSLPANIS